MTTTGCDPRALQVARELHQAEQPEITILFGSRARGDYEEGRSDIDILLIRDNLPTLEQETVIEQNAEELTQSLYGWKVPVQTVWYTSREFDQMRRTVNHVIARALKDGIIMPSDPEDYGNRYSDDEQDHSQEWTITGESCRHAENHLVMFDLIIDSGRAGMDDMMGQQAHQALEHAMKGLISARGWQYKTTHNLNELVGQIRRADPAFRFKLTINGEIYNQYVGSDEYERTDNLLTSIPNFYVTTKSDVQLLLDRTNQVQDDKSR